MEKRVNDLENLIHWFYDQLLSIEQNGIKLNDWTMFGVSGFDFTNIKLDAEKRMNQLGIQYDSERALVYEEHEAEYSDCELNPCGLCGGKPYENMAGIFCEDCGMGVSRYGKTNKQVVEAWNNGEIDEL